MIHRKSALLVVVAATVSLAGCAATDDFMKNPDKEKTRQGTAIGAGGGRPGLPRLPNIKPPSGVSRTNGSAGRLLTPLARAGYTCVGVDVSPAMLALAGSAFWTPIARWLVAEDSTFVPCMLWLFMDGADGEG